MNSTGRQEIFIDQLSEFEITLLCTLYQYYRVRQQSTDFYAEYEREIKHAKRFLEFQCRVYEESLNDALCWLADEEFDDDWEAVDLFVETILNNTLESCLENDELEEQLDAHRKIILESLDKNGRYLSSLNRTLNVSFRDIDSTIERLILLKFEYLESI